MRESFEGVGVEGFVQKSPVSNFLEEKTAQEYHQSLLQFINIRISIHVFLVVSAQNNPANSVGFPADHR